MTGRSVGFEAIGNDNAHKVNPDHGCAVAPRCLSCPLPYCKFDRQGRDAMIVSVFQETRPRMREAEQLFKLSRNSIEEILRRARAEAAL